MHSFSPVRKYRINHQKHQQDNTSRSEMIIGIGAHKPTPPDVKIANIKNKNASESELKPLLDKILIDLNKLPEEKDCPYGCKLDVYFAVRHRPGCPHSKIREVNIGMKKFDFIGKGTYPYRQHDTEHGYGYSYDYGRKCEEFSNRCDRLLNEMSARKSYKSKRLMKQGPFYQVIDEYSMVNTTLVDDRPVSRLYQRRNFTQSEVDLYALDFIEDKY